MKVINEETVVRYLKVNNDNFRRVKLELQIEEYEKSDYIPTEKLLIISGDYGLSLIRMYLERGLSFSEITSKTGVQQKLLKKYCKERFGESVLEAHKQRVEKKEQEELFKKGARGRGLKATDIPIHVSSSIETRKPITVIMNLDEVRELVKPLLKYGITVKGISRNFGLADCDRAKLKLTKSKIDLELADKIWSSLYTQVYDDPYFLYETLDRYGKFSLDEELKKHLNYCIKERNKNINLYKRGKTVIQSKNRRFANKKPVFV
ncbi:hypothetical protein ACQUY5_29680 [Bacillus cereus]|uniref:hypothetical protein n=1 Tax=Bacillus cereus TaxID=1396 RepID=UPI003D16F567